MTRRATANGKFGESKKCSNIVTPREVPLIAAFADAGQPG
jgi:hypothetical protein